MNEPVLYLEDIRRSFDEAGGRLDVLRGCNLRIDAGQKVALIGPSGAGKSTLLHIAGLLESPSEGIVYLSGRPASGADEATRTALRRDHIGFVYQFHHLLPEFSARENIILPQMIRGITKDEAAVRADDLLRLIDLDKRSHHRPAELSGGEQQRVAIARALANRPRLLIADEPTGNLDPHTSDHVFRILCDLVAHEGLGLLMATHNLELAARMDQIYRLHDGCIEPHNPL